MTEGIIGETMASIAQTRQEIQGTKANVLTRPESTRDDQDAKRSPTNRLIRASIAHALTLLRDDPRATGEGRQVLYDFAKDGRELTANLDKLDAQYRSNTTELDDGAGGKIHAVTLDLKEFTEGEEDTRTPWVMIGGATSTDEQNAALPMAMALQGHKITILTYPAQMKLQKGGEGRGPIEPISNMVRKDFNKFKHAGKCIGYKKMNLIGHSLGGAMVIGMASRPDFVSTVEVDNVVALAPTGFEKRSTLAISLDFVKEGGKLNSDPEAKVFLDQGVVDANRPSGVGGKGTLGYVKMAWDSLSGGMAAATNMITVKTLDRASSNIKGELEIWTSSEDKIINADAIDQTIRSLSRGKVNNVFHYNLVGGNHNSYFTEALGFTRVREEEQEARHTIITPFIGKTVGVDSMERSGAEYLHKKKQQSAHKAA